MSSDLEDDFGGPMPEAPAISKRQAKKAKRLEAKVRAPCVDLCQGFVFGSTAFTCRANSTAQLWGSVHPSSGALVDILAQSSRSERAELPGVRLS